MRTSRTGSSRLAVSLLVVFLAGCGPVEGGPDERGTHRQGLASANGLSFNGLSFNGLSFNGLSFNGLSFNGLSSAEFAAWFQTDPVLAAQVMKYVVRCAVPAGQTRSYTDPVSGTTHTWEGLLGLAVDWASGRMATTAEQQVVSACLAAHATRSGVSMPVSILGLDGRGRPIPYTPQELRDYPEQEACFFGNLFTGEGVFVGTDQGLISGIESSPRQCGMSPGPLQVEGCGPLRPAGSCELACSLDLLRPYHSACYRGGTAYRAITTRLRTEDIYHCGDGVCQFTESCGVGAGYVQCTLDCGLCL
jgi:hypothetical protein